MNDKFSEQKDTLVSIKKEISLLHQQVDYLLRNEKPLGLLDLDVMMNRTHTIYDLMCGMEVESEALETNDEALEVKSDEEEIPVDPETIRALFGVEQETPAEEEEPVEIVEEPVEEEEPTEIIDEPIREEEPIQEAPQPIEETTDKPEDFGFILNFEPTEEKPVYTTGDKIEMDIPHTEETPVETETPVEEAPVEEEIPVKEEVPAEEEIPYEPVIFGNMEEKEDSGFELDAPETLGDRLQQEEDHSLAAKLQHSTVNDLRTAIGINDKFLLVNELFGGSMEKYNRSMDNLNDLKTLNGALIYMNELRIELQWNSNNEAYKKLLELVHRKFEA